MISLHLERIELTAKLFVQVSELVKGYIADHKKRFLRQKQERDELAASKDSDPGIKELND